MWSIYVSMRVCRWPTRSPFSSCPDLFQIEWFSQASALRSYFLCLWEKRKTERCKRILVRGVHEWTWFSAAWSTSKYTLVHNHFRYFSVCSDHGGGLVRPEDIVLLNTSDNILLGGIPGAEQKKIWEHYTKNICSAKGRAGLINHSNLQNPSNCHFTGRLLAPQACCSLTSGLPGACSLG